MLKFSCVMFHRRSKRSRITKKLNGEEGVNTTGYEEIPITIHSQSQQRISSKQNVYMMDSAAAVSEENQGIGTTQAAGEQNANNLSDYELAAATTCSGENEDSEKGEVGRKTSTHTQFDYGIENKQTNEENTSNHVYARPLKRSNSTQATDVILKDNILYTDTVLTLNRNPDNDNTLVDNDLYAEITSDGAENGNTLVDNAIYDARQ